MMDLREIKIKTEQLFENAKTIKIKNDKEKIELEKELTLVSNMQKELKDMKIDSNAKEIKKIINKLESTFNFMAKVLNAWIGGKEFEYNSKIELEKKRDEKNKLLEKNRDIIQDRKIKREKIELEKKVMDELEKQKMMDELKKQKVK